METKFCVKGFLSHIPFCLYSCSVLWGWLNSTMHKFGVNNFSSILNVQQICNNPNTIHSQCLQLLYFLPIRFAPPHETLCFWRKLPSEEAVTQNLHFSFRFPPQMQNNREQQRGQGWQCKDKTKTVNFQKIACLFTTSLSNDSLSPSPMKEYKQWQWGFGQHAGKQAKKFGLLAFSISKPTREKLLVCRKETSRLNQRWESFSKIPDFFFFLLSGRLIIFIVLGCWWALCPPLDKRRQRSPPAPSSNLRVILLFRSTEIQTHQSSGKMFKIDQKTKQASRFDLLGEGFSNWKKIFWQAQL